MIFFGSINPSMSFCAGAALILWSGLDRSYDCVWLTDGVDMEHGSLPNLRNIWAFSIETLVTDRHLITKAASLAAVGN